MYLLFKHFIFLCAISFSGLAIAQESIAVVDVQAAAMRSDYAKSAIDKLNQNDAFKKSVEEYKRLGGEFNELQKEAKTNALTWSDKEKQKHKEKLEKKLAGVNKIGEQLNAGRTALERNIMRELTPKIEKIVPEIIKEKKLGLLLNARAVYFRTPEFDITQELIDRLNKSK